MGFILTEQQTHTHTLIQTESEDDKRKKNSYFPFSTIHTRRGWRHTNDIMQKSFFFNKRNIEQVQPEKTKKNKEKQKVLR